MAKISGDKTKKSILRILAIWQERNIYDAKLIKEFTTLYQKAWDDLHDDEFESFSPVENSPTALPALAEADAADSSSRKRKSSESSSSKDRRHSEGDSSSSDHHRRKRVRTKKEEIDAALRKRSMEATNTVDELEADGVRQLEVKLSPSPYREVPTEEELIQMIKVRLMQCSTGID